MLNCLAVGLGGFAGSVCRYLMGLLPLGRNWAFPIRTLAINLIGSFVIGAVTALALKRSDPDPRLVLFLKAGVCGGFTTFSSFALETGTCCAADTRQRPCSTRAPVWCWASWPSSPGRQRCAEGPGAAEKKVLIF